MIREGPKGVNQTAALLLTLVLGCSSRGEAPVAEDLEARLSLVDPEPEVGRPFRVRLEMTNRGENTYLYDDEKVKLARVLEVRAVDGPSVRYLGWSWSIGEGGPRRLRPGETVTLYEEIDVSQEHEVNRPGAYTVQFIGGGVSLAREHELEFFPPGDPNGSPLLAISRHRLVSNKLRVNVGPGDSIDREVLRATLSPLLPEPWSIGPQVTVRLHGRTSSLTLTRWGSLREVVSAPLRLAEVSPGPDHELVGEFRGRKLWIEVTSRARAAVEEIRPTLRNLISR